MRERLGAGFWNEIVGRQDILFIFKLGNGAVKEVALSEATPSEIAGFCSSTNEDPIEQTANLPRYLSGNPLYGELIAAFYASESR